MRSLTGGGRVVVVGVGETPQKCVTSSLHLISLVSVAQGQSGDVIDRAAGQ